MVSPTATRIPTTVPASTFSPKGGKLKGFAIYYLHEEEEKEKRNTSFPLLAFSSPILP
jgi:hypothetical protein